jgi:hypothetical protein
MHDERSPRGGDVIRKKLGDRDERHAKLRRLWFAVLCNQLEDSVQKASARGGRNPFGHFGKKAGAIRELVRKVRASSGQTGDLRCYLVRGPSQAGEAQHLVPRAVGHALL